MTYKLAYLNPWRNAAENQAFNSLRVAASRLGVTLIHCTNSMDLDGCEPDFVLATASTQPKLTRHPTFGVIHEARDRFLLNREYFNNLLTYDGYLTISDTLRDFLGNILTGIGRQCEIGEYYNVPHRVDLQAPVESLAAEGRIRLTYFGTNWDNRQRELFQHLDQEGLIDIYGPQQSWSYLSDSAYRGVLPFDGEAPQRTYAQNGAGLVLLSESHLRDDIISNRVFEICSAGAVAIACDTPWLRKHFGDALYYFDQRAPARHITQRLRDILFEIQEDPAAASARAAEGRKVFENRFSAEVLLTNAIQYFERWRHARVSRDRRLDPAVSVIVRCGGRATITRTLQSLKEQTFGRVKALLVQWRDFDVAPLRHLLGDALIELHTISCPGADRSATLSAGLKAIETPYFAILDDDDCWFPTHLERVFDTFRTHPDARLVVTGWLKEYEKPFSVMGGGVERRRINGFGVPGPGASIWDLGAALAPSGFVAEASLLDWRLTADSHMVTGEDSALEIGLVAKQFPRFSYAATTVQFHSEDGSRFLDDPRRSEDMLTLWTRRIDELDKLIGREERWNVIARTLVRALAEKDSLVRHFPDRTVYASYKVDYLSVSEDPSKGEMVPLDGSRVSLSGESLFFRVTSRAEPSGTTCVEVAPPAQPWAYGAVIKLGRPELLDRDSIAVLRGRVEVGLLGVTLMDETEREPLFRRVLAADGKAFELHVPLLAGARIGSLVLHNWEGNFGRAVLEAVSVV